MFHDLLNYGCIWTLLQCFAATRVDRNLLLR